MSLSPMAMNYVSGVLAVSFFIRIEPSDFINVVDACAALSHLRSDGT